MIGLGLERGPLFWNVVIIQDRAVNDLHLGRRRSMVNEAGRRHFFQENWDSATEKLKKKMKFMLSKWLD
jgi:hypothetical protein